jgi:hypothetical protein
MARRRSRGDGKQRKDDSIELLLTRTGEDSKAPMPPPRDPVLVLHGCCHHVQRQWCVHEGLVPENDPISCVGLGSEG